MSRKIDSPPAAPAAPTGASLRERAEAAFQANLAKSSAPPKDLSPEALQRTLHDLQVHHLELEMQNEELRRAQLELEASRARWFDLYDLAPVGYFTVNEAGLILQANLCRASLLGAHRSDLIGQPISRFIFVEDQDRYYLLRKCVLLTGETQSCELRLTKSDGAPFWAQVAAAAYCEEGGSRAIRLVVSDISERKQLEKRSLEAEQFLRDVFDSLGAHTVVVGGDGKIVSFNQAWRAFALANGGLGGTVLEGASYLDACDKAAGECPEAGEVARAIRAVLAGERDWPSVEYPCHSPQQERWFLCSIKGVRRGQERLAVVSHVDVSALKSFEAQLSASNAALLKSQELSEAANRAKTAFLANMSHEIRTPLTSILGFVDLLRDEGDQVLDLPQRIQALDAIKNAGEHLLVVINDILDISKVEADKITVEHVDMSLVDILTDVDHLLRPLAAAKGMEFDITFATPLPERMVGDPTRLRQILLNVAGNAVKFTDKGKVTLLAGLQSRGGATRLAIDVDDTGLGLAPDQIQNLFRAFGQADGSTTRKYGGTGLGLALSRRMAELMDGSVTLVRSSPGQGSCFRVELPLEFRPGVALISHFKAQPIAKIPTDTEQHTILRGRILLAEDGPDNQRLIALHLRKAGALVDVADNGRIALEMLDSARAKGQPYELLLTDMQMPEIDGYTLARTLRRRGGSLPIVALTAHAMPDDGTKCLEAGCSDYETKPINKQRLLAICAKWLAP